MDSMPLLKVNHLVKTFSIKERGGKRSPLRAVDGVSFALPRGGTFGLVGESGCGKTTLGRLILRLLEPDSGAVYYNGNEITRANMKQYRSRMQIIFQNPAASLDPRMQIRDIVAEGLAIHHPDMAKKERREIVMELLERVGIGPDDAARYPNAFSGGQQQRIGIARALAVQPEFIVCDEPVSSLDVSYQSQILNLLKEMQCRLMLSYLFISHDLSVVRHIADSIGVMYSGRLVETGASGEILTHAAHPYTKELLSSVPLPDPVSGRQRADAAEYSYRNERQQDAGGGCDYCRLCPSAEPVCRDVCPGLTEIAPGHFCACHLYEKTG